MSVFLKGLFSPEVNSILLQNVLKLNKLQLQEADAGLSDGQAEEEQGVGGQLLEEHHCPQKVRDGCLIVFDNIILYSGGCYDMLLCFLLARGCPGGMEHAAASQVMHSGLYLLVRGVVQV